MADDPFVRTGVFVSPAKVAIAMEAIKRAERTPVILVGTVDASASAWDQAKRLIHGFALEEGLPEIPGFYGIDAAGEVLAPRYSDGL